MKETKIKPWEYTININNTTQLFTKTSIYIPNNNDKIICRVFYCGSQYYKLDLFSNSTHTAVLHVLSFTNATKRMRPKLEMNDILICNVESIGETELIVTCIYDYLGPLPLLNPYSNKKHDDTNEMIGGVLLQMKPSKCKLLYFSNILLEISKEYDYEIYIGLNGIIWLNSNKTDRQTIGKLLLS